MNYMIVTLIGLLLSFNNNLCSEIKNTAYMEETADESASGDKACTDMEKQAYIEMVTGETTMNELGIKDCIITADYWPNPDNHRDPCLVASIRYPQISGMEDKSIEKKVNNLLLNAATQSLNHKNADQTLRLFNDIVNHGLNTFWSGENEYNIIHMSEDCISVSYEGESYFGGLRPSFFHDYITISLTSGEMLPFTDYFSKEDVIKAIRSLKFELIEGQYSPGGYKGDEPKITEGFAEAVKKLEDNTETYMGNTYNFAIDDKSAYIEFPFYDSLWGYVILKFSLDALK